MTLKNLLIICGVVLLWVAVMACIRSMNQNSEDQARPAELGLPVSGLPGLGFPGTLEPSPNVISCSNGVFIFAYAKLIKLDKTSLEQIGEIKLPQGYSSENLNKDYKIARNADGVERILVFLLSKMLVIDTASCKVLRTIALPVVPSPSLGLPQGKNIAVGPSPYTFVDEPVVENNDVVYFLCGPRIAAVNYETGKSTVSHDLPVPGVP